MLSLDKDINGNKTLRFRGFRVRSFCVQTLGNLPLTHAMTGMSFDPLIARQELGYYVDTFGTKSQQDKLGMS